MLRAHRQQAATYDLSINGLHAYYVLAGNTAILVHNCGDGEESEPYDVTVRWQEGMPKSQFSLKAAELQGLSDTVRCSRRPTRSPATPQSRTSTRLTSSGGSTISSAASIQILPPHFAQGSFAR
jgi:hypothetical protein